MNELILNSCPEFLGKTDKTLYDAAELSKEPMLFSADTDYAYKNGGSITKDILKQIESKIPEKSPDSDYPYLTIDTRVHMLMPNMYPAIPGWHCDFTPRNGNGQPNLNMASKRQYNLAVFVSSTDNVSRTDFIKGNIAITKWNNNLVWGSINKFLNADLKGVVQLQAMEGDIIYFSGQTLHRANQALTKGWRLFLRCSYKSQKPINEIRRQTQVYMLESTGW